MSIFWWIAGSLLALVWLHRVWDAGWGMRTITDLARPEWAKASKSSPKISIVVPARNEEERAEMALRSLLSLDYPDYEVIAVDDRSTDQTGVIFDRLASESSHCGTLRVLHLTDLPSGWLGKPHAMWNAARIATGEWLLFTDADINFRSDTLRRAMNFSEKTQADHTVIFPTITHWTVGKKIILAGFNILFVFGHRAWKVADPKTRDHLGVGAFNLVRREVYGKIGTFEALRMEVIEDMRLGKLIKDAGFAQRCAFGTNLLTLPWGDNALGIVRNLTKNFFALMHFDIARTIGACFLLIFLNWLPFLGIWLAHGWAKLPFGLALLGIFCMYVGMYIRAPISPFYFVFHPISTFFLLYTMIRSVAHTLRNDGVVWRDTRYSLEELRRGLVKG